MIGTNFIYCRPECEEEAVACYQQYSGEGKSPLYCGSGSEIITMATAGSLTPTAVIDLTRIPALRVMEARGDAILIGAARTLEDIRLSGWFPLLAQTCGRISDHSNQCRITLGGNLCGTIMYREALLPLLLSDAALVLFGPEGHRLMPIHEVFDGRLRLLPGEFIIAAQVPRAMAQAPFTHIKRTFTERIGYPAVTVAALRWQGELRVAFSGLGSAPFRSGAMEQALNNRALPAKERVEGALSLLPEPPMDSCEGSGGYRAQLLALALEEVLEVLG